MSSFRMLATMALCPALAGMALSAPACAQMAPAASSSAAPAPAAPAPATATAVGNSGGLVIADIRVDSNGNSPEDARRNGWREAQRLAWPHLWARMSGMAATTAPALSDGELDQIVSAIEIEREEVGPKRYVATLAVVFDRLRSAAYLGRFSDVVASPPYLVIPVLQAAAVRQAYEPGSPWLEAWDRLRSGETPVDYVRIRPNQGDRILLNAWQTERRHLFLWRMLADRYQVADVLVPELLLDQSYAGGPIQALLIARFGISGRELGRARLTNRAGNLQNLMDSAVREADRIYAAALRDGRLKPEKGLASLDQPLEEIEDSSPLLGSGFGGVSDYEIRIDTPDDATLQAMQRALKAIPGVAAVQLKRFVLGGESVLAVDATLTTDELRYALDREGLRLDQGRLRPRAEGEAPLPPPAAVGAGDIGVEEVTIPAGAAQAGAGQPVPPPSATPPAAQPIPPPAARP